MIREFGLGVRQDRTPVFDLGMAEIYGFDTKIRVEYVDTDKMGVVHNSNYFRFFERARCETMRAIGINYKDVEACGVRMPVIEQYAKYILPAEYDEILTVRCSLERLPTVKMRFDYRISKIENGEEKILCNGYNILAFIDIHSGKPVVCPNWITEKLQKVLQLQRK